MSSFLYYLTISPKLLTHTNKQDIYYIYTYIHINSLYSSLQQPSSTRRFQGVALFRMLRIFLLSNTERQRNLLLSFGVAFCGFCVCAAKKQKQKQIEEPFAQGLSCHVFFFFIYYFLLPMLLVLGPNWLGRHALSSIFAMRCN